MQRREFIRKTGLGLAAAGGVAISSLSRAETPTVKWRVVSSFPKTLDTMYGAPEMLSKRIAQLTEGKFTVQVLAGEYSTPVSEFLDIIHKDTAECIHTSSYYFHGRNKAFSIDTAIPFGLTARQMSAWYYQGQGLALTREFFAKSNIVNFPSGNTGTQMGGWFRKEIKSTEELKGFKMRIGGFGAEVFSALGAVPVAIRGSDIASALKQGTVDGAEWVGPYDDEKLELHKAAKFYYYPGWWEPGPQLSFLVNKERWDQLPKTYQAAFEVAAAEVNTQVTAAYDERNPQALQRLIKEGIELRRYPDDMLKAAYEAAQKLYAEESSKNPDFKKLYDSLRAFQQLSETWVGLNEGAFNNFMQTQMRAKK